MATSSDVRITSIVKNESDKFLPKLLPIWRSLGEVCIVIDGTSDDVNETRELCEAHGAEWIVFETGWGEGESPMRQFQYDWASDGAEWLVHMDADHLPAGDFRPYLKGSRVGFYVYDMWGPACYRFQPPWWNLLPWWHAVRVPEVPDFVPVWNERSLHGGHLPQNRDEFGPVYGIPKHCGLLHLGYSTPELRKQKYEFYMSKADELTPRELFQARSIAHDNPKLRELGFTPTFSL